MSGDELAKWLFGAVLSAVSVVVGWVVRTVLDSRENIIGHRARIDALERAQITEECVREVIEAALDKRDKLMQDHRAETDRLRKLEVKEAIREELAVAVPKIVQEVTVALRAGGGEAWTRE